MSRRSELKTVIDYWRDLYRQAAKRRVTRRAAFSLSRNLGLAFIGVRRCGKTWLTTQILSDPDAAFYLNFEDPFFTEMNETSILDEACSVYVEYYGSPEVMIFDELHNIANWEKWLRKLIDGKSVKVAVTGSSAKMLSSELASSLTGRCLTHVVWPLSFAEFLDFTRRRPANPDEHLHALRAYIETGGFPEVVLTRDESMRVQILRQYLGDILYKDVIKRHNVRSAATLELVANYYLANISSQHSLNSTARAFDLNVDTVGDYTAFLEEAFLVFTMARYHRNLKVQVRDTKKIYAIDTGLRNAHVVRHSEDRGRLVENVVYLELRRRGNLVYYFRENGETDFVVVERGRPIMAVQVCSDDMDDVKTEEREIGSLMECLDAVKLKQGLIITRKREEIFRRKGKTIRMTPLYKWLLRGT